MDYYKLRARITQELKEFLLEREESQEKKETPQKWSIFEMKMLSKYGATPKMLVGILEMTVPGATIEEDDLIRKK